MAPRPTTPRTLARAAGAPTTGRKRRKAGPRLPPSPAQASLLNRLTVGGSRKGGRMLTAAERDALVGMFSIKSGALDLDPLALAPEGSILRRMQAHFADTDISYTLPTFALVMVAASWLTQTGATLEIPGLRPVLPTLWTIGLAESGNSKTLATDRVMSILAPTDKAPAVRMLAPGGSDAQWIQDLAGNNGAFWFQDEIGKFFSAILTQGTWARLKPWMLNAYSHETIANRLKSEANKLLIERPAFTLHGLSVLSTWPRDIDASSMLDGFCQRPNYYVAAKRTGSDMFDHFLYFVGDGVLEREARLRETWQALCAQPGASGPYRLGPGVLAHLEAWWRSLRPAWGDGAVPASFVRRIGFSALRYLMVLHFLLGKARWPIDVETARLATAYVEYHLESTRVMIEGYDQRGAETVRTIAAVQSDLLARGEAVTARAVARRMSRVQRAGLDAETIRAVLETLDGLKVDGRALMVGEGLDADLGAEAPDGARTRGAALRGALGEVEVRLGLTERKRNERRLRILVKDLRATRAAEAAAEITSATEPPAVEAQGASASLPSSAAEEPSGFDLIADILGESSGQGVVVPFPGQAASMADGKADEGELSGSDVLGASPATARRG